MKFDGVVENNQNAETFGDPVGYVIMEYVYYLMATQCDTEMNPCHLLDDGDRRHFLTQRFDRVENQKIHVQTLTAMAHVDYNTLKFLKTYVKGYLVIYLLMISNNP